MRLVTVDKGSPDDIFTGACLIWVCYPRGGYGYSVLVPARVIRICKSRVRIEVRKTNGERVERSVKAESLRWK